MRRRLENRFGRRSFVILSEPDGWRWDIPQRPLRSRRVFPSVEAAVDHADVYTRTWWPAEEEQQAPTPAAADEVPVAEDEVVSATKPAHGARPPDGRIPQPSLSA